MLAAQGWCTKSVQQGMLQVPLRKALKLALITVISWVAWCLFSLFDLMKHLQNDALPAIRSLLALFAARNNDAGDTDCLRR
jgi:hypothetical protein